MSDRHTVNTITSDALDALYESLDAAQTTELYRQLRSADAAFASATVRAAKAEAAVARVRALHADDYGLCRECTNSHGVLYPCPTVRALDGEDPQS